MKNLIIFFLLSFTPAPNSVYDFVLPKIEGGSYSLSAAQNKKIMVILLPVEQSAASNNFLTDLDSLALSYEDSLKVIAVPSYEDGFTDAAKDSLKLWYRSRIADRVIITNGMYTRKSSGTQQHLLFKWLTHASENEVFDYDVDGPGHKFFIKPGGVLYGQLLSQYLVLGNAVTHTLQMQ